MVTCAECQLQALFHIGHEMGRIPILYDVLYFLVYFLPAPRMTLSPEGFHLRGCDCHFHTRMVCIAHWFHGTHVCNYCLIYLITYSLTQLAVRRQACCLHLVAATVLDFSFIIFFLHLIPYKNQGLLHTCEVRHCCCLVRLNAFSRRDSSQSNAADAALLNVRVHSS